MRVSKSAVLGVLAVAAAIIGVLVMTAQPFARPAQSDSDQGVISTTLGF